MTGGHDGSAGAQCAGDRQRGGTLVILGHEVGLAVTLTKDAASQTGERLIAAAAEAAQQPIVPQEDGPAAPRPTAGQMPAPDHDRRALAEAMRYKIDHQTRYAFARPVTLQPHRLLVTPRSGAELKLLDLSVDAGPDTAIAWTDDVFANRIATLSFEGPRERLKIAVTATVEQNAPAYPVFTIALAAHHYPFAYSDDDRTDLGALLVPLRGPDAEQVAAWSRAFVAGPGTDTLALLKDINAGIVAGAVAGIVYRVRDEEGTQSPAETLRLKSGTCRDIAALFIDAVRHLGFGARAVSGYLYDPGGSTGDAGSTHAWAEVYLPEAGWITFDPTHQRIGDAGLIPVAVARYNGQIMPLTGGYLGTAQDAAGMEVTVRVTALS